MSSFLLSNSLRIINTTSINHVRNYAVKSAASGSLMSLGKGKKVGKTATVEKIVIPLETDSHKLVNYVCGSNIFKEGEDVKIKPDSEYPDWLWELKTGPPPNIHELDPNSKAYWIRVRRYAMQQNRKAKTMRR